MLDDLRSIGQALKGAELGAFWKYRVGDYRIISSIEDRALKILVVRVGNRRELSTWKRHLATEHRGMTSTHS